MENPRSGYAEAQLLWALQKLATIHNLPFSKSRALEGLPLGDDGFTIKLFTRSAGKLGFESQIVSKPPSRVPAIVYPFVLLFKNGQVGVALEKNNQQNLIKVQMPGEKDPVTRKPSELDRDCFDAVVYASPKQQELFAGEENGPAKQGHWLWSETFRFWPTWTYIILAALVINLLGLALPLFIMNVYDRVIPHNSISTLWALVFGVMIALFFDFTLRIVRSVLIDNASRRVDMAVSSKLFEQALDARMANRGPRAGELANQIREFESVRDFFTSAGLVAVIDLFFIGIFLGVLWIIVGKLVFVALIAVPIVLLFTLFLQLPLSRAVRNTQVATTNRHSVLVESLVGIETIKAVSAEGTMQNRWENAVASAVRASSSTHFWSSLAIYFTMYAQQIVSVVMVTWGVFLIAEGQITVGALIASNILAGRVLAPLGSIAMTFVRAQQSFNALGFLNRFMNLKRDHVASWNKKGMINSGKLEFRDVSFSYPGQENKALDGIQLSMKEGEKIGIIGKVGSGKSSLGKLLAGLYDPDDGAVVVDGTDIRHYAVADLRKAVMYVAQETELFSGTLRDNLLIGGPADEDILAACADVAGVTAFADAHPLGFQMPVGERGKEISGGQRQSVGIARGLIAGPKILFLDEPTGQMDRMSEDQFVRKFKDWQQGKVTLLLATHRTPLLELVDRVIIIDNGKIVADGPRDQVLASLAGPAKAAKQKGNGG